MYEDERGMKILQLLESLISPQGVNAGVHDEAAGAKYLGRVVAVPVVRVVVKAQVEAQALCVETPTFDVRSVDWESRRALKVTK